jgi:proline iminopeptidase
MHSAAPLYSETFDADAALSSTLKTVYYAESHSRLITKVQYCKLMPVDDLYSEQEKYFDYRADLNKIGARTLIIVGDQDWICPPRQSEIMASHIPGSRLEIFRGANHSVHHEKNEAVIRLIHDWAAE